jgi:hypothetical protein
MYHAFRAGEPSSNITVKNTVGKAYQHLTAIFWLFTLRNILCSDSSEERTASFFRVTEQVQNDGRISVDYMRGFDRIWLITNMEGKETSDLVLNTIPKTDHCRTSTNGRSENSGTSGRLAVLSDKLYSCGHR